MKEERTLPVRKVSDNCYQWGNQKVYCGKDAKKKATLQGIAIRNTGWKEAEGYMEEFEQHYEDFLKKGKNTLRNRLSIYPHQKWVTTKKDLAKAVAISKLTENDLVSDETIIELYVNNFTKRQLFILNDLHYSLYSNKTKVGLAQQLIDKIRKPAWNYNDWKRIYGSESSEKDEASIIVKALNDAGYEALFVGGVVRDMLMGLEPKDYDLGTSATPEEVANVVNGLEGYKYIFGPEGERAKRALTSLVKPPEGEVIEVTTFRKEMYVLI